MWIKTTQGVLLNLNRVVVIYVYVGNGGVRGNLPEAPRFWVKADTHNGTYCLASFKTEEEAESFKEWLYSALTKGRWVYVDNGGSNGVGAKDAEVPSTRPPGSKASGSSG